MLPENNRQNFAANMLKSVAYMTIIEYYNKKPNEHEERSVELQIQDSIIENRLIDQLFRSPVEWNA
tara:strand:- start:1250 stop:1447 length:198 start_codon:yes stop_codon:yes gene_type:complete